MIEDRHALPLRGALERRRELFLSSSAELRALRSHHLQLVQNRTLSAETKAIQWGPSLVAPPLVGLLRRLNCHSLGSSSM